MNMVKVDITKEDEYETTINTTDWIINNITDSSWYNQNDIMITTSNRTVSLNKEIERLSKENEDLKYILNRLGDILKQHNIDFDAEREIKNRDLLNNI